MTADLRRLGERMYSEASEGQALIDALIVPGADSETAYNATQGV